MAHIEARISADVGNGRMAEVVEQVLDKGIVIDATAQISVAGLELVTLKARVLVASFDTYLRYADAIGNTMTAPELAA
jgi:gas vesicle structural protein